MTQTVQRRTVSAVMSYIELAKELSVLKVKLEHPAFSGTKQLHRREEIKERIKTIQIELCWMEPSSTPSDQLIYRPSLN